MRQVTLQRHQPDALTLLRPYSAPLTLQKPGAVRIDLARYIPTSLTLLRHAPVTLSLQLVGDRPVTTGDFVNLAGVAQTSGVASGQIDVSLSLSGDATNDSGAAGTLSAAIDMAGTSDGAGVASGSIDASASILGESDGQGAISGAVDTSASLSGVSSGGGVASGAIETQEPGAVSLSGEATGQGETAGSVDASTSLSGSATGSGQASGALSVSADLSGASSGAGSSDGSVSADVSIAGDSMGDGQADGMITADVNLAGDTQGSGAASGAISADIALTGTGAGIGAAAGAISSSKDLSGSASGTGSAAGDISASASLSGASAGTGSSSGAASATALLAGASNGSGTAAGAVTTTAPGPSYIGLAPFVSGTTSLSPDFTSSGRASGDLLFLFVSTANRAVTTPSGWTLLALTPASGTADAAGAVRLTVFFKVSTGSETTVSLTITSAGFSSACGLVVRGADTTSVTNLLRNSTDLTNTTYWHVFANGGSSAQITGGVLAISGVTSGIGQANAGIYTDSFTTLTSGATYTLLYEEKASTGTKVSASNMYATAAGLDVDNISPDVTVGTGWTRQKQTVTMPASVTYTNMGFCVGSALADTSVIIRNVMIVSGSAAADLAYVPTLTASGSSVAGISSAVGQVQSATTSISFVDALAYKDNCLIVNVMANDRDAASTSNISNVTNANLTNLTLRLDQTVTTGAGGGLALITGNLATAGSTGNTTATNSPTGVTNASITLVLAA